MEAREVTIINISISELKDIIRETICEELSKINAEKNASDTEFIDRVTTAKLLRISLPTLTKYVKKGLIPAHRIGTRILFKESEVKDSLKQVQKIINSHK